MHVNNAWTERLRRNLIKHVMQVKCVCIMKFCNAMWGPRTCACTVSAFPAYSSTLQVNAEHSSIVLVTTYQTALSYNPDTRTSILTEKTLYLKWWGGMRWCCWLRHYGTSWKVAGSRPVKVTEFFSMYLTFRLHWALMFIQPLTEMSTKSRKIMFLGSSAAGVRRANNLAAICLDNVRSLTSIIL
jgi:hypothetical protein